MLDDMYSHFLKTKNKSLLARIYGIFTINSNVFSHMDVIVMENTCRIKQKSNETMTFDLKGSTIGRKTKLKPHEHQFWRHTHQTKRVLKDLNYKEIN